MTVTQSVKRVTAEKKSSSYCLVMSLMNLLISTFEWKGLKKLCVAVSFQSIIAEQKKEPEMTGQILYQPC